MSETYKKQELKSSEYYSSVVDVSFTPSYELFPRLEHKKGDPIYEVYWFRKKKVGEYDNNYYTLYDSEYGSVYTPRPIEELASTDYHRVVINGRVYRMARVCITTKSGGKSHWFDTNEEASEYLEEIKTKCGQCGNKLL